MCAHFCIYWFIAIVLCISLHTQNSDDLNCFIKYQSDHNTLCSRSSSIDLTRAAAGKFGVINDMLCDSQPTRSIQLDTTDCSDNGEEALQCCKHLFEVARALVEGKPPTASFHASDIATPTRLMSKFGADPAIREYVYTNLVNHKGDEIYEKIKPLFCGNAKIVGVEKAAVEDLFIKSIQALSDAKKKEVRRFWYAEQYKSKEFLSLKEVVDTAIAKKEYGEIAQLPVLQAWESSLERRIFCAAIGNESSLHRCYYCKDSEKKLPFYGEKSIFLEQFCTNASTGFDFLHMPLMRLVMRYDRRSGNWCDYGDGGYHPTTTAYHFDAYPVYLYDVDCETIAQFPIRHARSTFVWHIALKNDTESVPWESLQRFSTGQNELGQKDYARLNIYTNKVVALSKLPDNDCFFLAQSVPWQQKLKNVGMYGFRWVVAAALFGYCIYALFKGSHAYEAKINAMAETIPLETRQIASLLTQPSQTILPGCLFTLPSIIRWEAGSPSNLTLDGVQKALHAIRAINNISYPLSFFFLGGAFFMGTAFTTLQGFITGRLLLRSGNESTFLPAGPLQIRSATFWDCLLNDKISCIITIHKGIKKR